MHPLPQCQHLQGDVEQILQLLSQVPQLSNADTNAVRSSLKKAIAPTFEIVFAGAFSAGKSMLINALLERELLYSAEGHATGTECKIAYAEVDAERVVLTFLSETEIWEQIAGITDRLGLTIDLTTQQPQILAPLLVQTSEIIGSVANLWKLIKSATQIRIG
jgi:GTPase SAR1 family protein